MHADLLQHRRRDLAGERPLRREVHVLGEDLDSRAPGRVDHRRERGERRADRDLGAVGGRDAREQRGDELLGLGDRLVHLPVPGDQRRPVAHASASTPGRALPSISSSEAPPPVDRCVTRSASPNSAERGGGVATADDGDRLAGGDGLGDGPGTGGERRHLERAHRPVPEHRARHRPRSSRRRPRALRGPTSSPIHPSGTSTPSIGLGGRVGGESLGDHEVLRQHAARLGRRLRGERRPGELDVLRGAQRVPDLVALGGEEREAHRAADQDRVGRLLEALDHRDLVAHLRPAEHRDERTARVGEQAREGLDLPLRAAGRRRDRRSGGRRPRSMRGRGGRCRTRR